MAGPGGPGFPDLESGNPVAPASNHALTIEQASFESDKTGDSTDGRAASQQPSTSDQFKTPPASPEGHPSPDKLRHRIPLEVRKPWSKVSTYAKGPQPPRPWKIRPFLPRLQHLPLRLVDKLCPRQWQRIFALVIFYICWIATFAAVLQKSSATEDVNGYGEPIRVSCGTVAWSQNNGCGVNGTSCLPFSNGSFAFRCPANCLGEQLLNVRAVGAQDVIYQPLVVGGPTPDEANQFSYRGDSFICSAAIHAGVITNGKGGCGVFSLTGQQRDYPSVSQNGISSIGFDSYFPLSFTLLSTTASCIDRSWDLLAVSVVYTTLLSLFTRSASVFFYSTLVGCYLQAALATDTPSASDVSTLVSTAIGKLLPAIFIAIVMYRMYVRRTLYGLTAQFEKTILWLGPCWVATLADYTFELIPLSRLTAHDLNQQPGAIAALVIIVLVIFVVFIGQAWAFRREGRLLRYLGLYVCLGISIGLLAAIPQQSLRIHHYILALLLLPGTSLQTRPSLVYQGLLVGLFINGVAKWGFDPIVQTAAALQGDALLGTSVPMVMETSSSVSDINFTWPGVPEGYNGTSILVNDVERYRIYDSYGQDAQNFTWQRMVVDAPEYFRFAFFSLSAAYGMSMGDYTKAGTWFANGTWLQMAEGST